MPACRKCGAVQPERTAFFTSCGAVMDRPDTDPATATSVPPNPVAQPANPPPLAAPSAAAAPIEIGDVGVYIARRLTALVVDVCGVGFLVAVAVFAALTALHDRSAGGAWPLDAVIWPAIGVTVLLCFAVMEALFGATLGKGLVGLSVSRTDGRRIGFGRALLRNVFKPLDMCGIGFALATVTRRRQRLGDFFAGTVVSNSRMGRLAPILAVVIAGALSWAAFGWADGANQSQAFIQLARTDVARLLSR